MILVHGGRGLEQLVLRCWEWQMQPVSSWLVKQRRLSGDGASFQKPVPVGPNPPAQRHVPKVLQPSNMAPPPGTELSSTAGWGGGVGKGGRGDIADSTQVTAASLLGLP